MSELNKSRLEVQRILLNAAQAGMTALGHDGWTVMEFANSAMIRADRVVLLNYTRMRRVGWQSARSHLSDLDFVRTDEWIEEQSWQFHCINRREGAATPSEVLAEDMANDLVAWFNGRGAETLRASGVAPLRVDADSIIVYNDNSDLYQKRAVFTVKIQVPKELTTGDISVDAVIPKVKPI